MIIHKLVNVFYKIILMKYLDAIYQCFIVHISIIIKDTHWNWESSLTLLHSGMFPFIFLIMGS